MEISDLSSDVREWLEQSGWFPGRDIGEAEADRLIGVRVRDAERQGHPLMPNDAAVRVIRSFGLLTLAHPRGGLALEMRPTVGFDGDAALITELGENLGRRLFPVGHDSHDFDPLLVDESGRFFFMHHTGAYFWGSNVQDAFYHFLSDAEEVDAEDFFV